MILFLLAAIPVFALWVTSSLFAPSERTRGVSVAALSGLTTWAVFYLLYLVFQSAVNVEYRWGALYVFYLFHHTGFPLAVALVGYLLMMRFHRGLLSSFVFICSFFLLIAIHDVITQLQFLNTYLLFLLPFLRISMILFFAAATAYAGRLRLWARFGMVTTIPAFSACWAVVPMLYYLSYRVAAYSVAAALLSASASFYLMAYRSRETQRP